MLRKIKNHWTTRGKDFPRKLANFFHFSSRAFVNLLQIWLERRHERELSVRREAIRPRGYPLILIARNTNFRLAESFQFKTIHSQCLQLHRPHGYFFVIIVAITFPATLKLFNESLYFEVRILRVFYSPKPKKHVKCENYRTTGTIYDLWCRENFE